MTSGQGWLLIASVLFVGTYTTSNATAAGAMFLASMCALLAGLIDAIS